MATSLHPVARTALEDSRFRDALVRLVQRRVPAGEVEDIVQGALAEAVLSANAPRTDADTLRRWIWGVARHKVADFHRRPRAEVILPEGAYDDLCNDAAADDEAGARARDWMRWATRELPVTADAEETLQWMLREGDGETLETIASEANVPAPRVRQRVSRLRKHLKSRWAREVAALAALGVALGCVWLAWQRWHVQPEQPMAIPERIDSPHDIAERMRAEAIDDVARGAYDEALERLDRASAMDPAGDTSDAVRALRERIDIAKRPPPVTPAPETKPQPRRATPPHPKDGNTGKKPGAFRSDESMQK